MKSRITYGASDHVELKEVHELAGRVVRQHAGLFPKRHTLRTCNKPSQSAGTDIRIKGKNGDMWTACKTRGDQVGELRNGLVKWFAVR